jgi:hypothetical protein
VGDDDRPRLLHRRAELAYTDKSALALPHEPEAISEDEQRRQSDDARRRWKREQAREWGVARTEILAGVEHFRSNGHPDRRTLSDLHVMQRLTAKIDQRLGL